MFMPIFTIRHPGNISKEICAIWKQPLMCHVKFIWLKTKLHMD